MSNAQFWTLIFVILLVTSFGRLMLTVGLAIVFWTVVALVAFFVIAGLFT